MVSRRGSSSMGCLMFLLLLATGTYFAVTIAEPFWKNYQYADAMNQEVRFASTRTDAAIRRRLRDKAESLGLPESARNVRIRRGNGVIQIYTEYYLPIEFPGLIREVYFSPQAQGVF